MTTRRRKHDHSPGPLAESLLPGLAAIVNDLRPSWEAGLVLSIIQGHRSSVTAAVLVRACVDAADDPDVVDPRAIAWDLRRAQWNATTIPRCAVCGKPADQCARRPGLDDDHEFTDKAELSPVRPGWTHTCSPEGSRASGVVRLPDSMTSCRVCGWVRS
jgi:hypothetical protein